MNESSVPEPLLPFVDLVHRWGAITSDSERYALSDKAEANPQSLRALEQFNNALTKDVLQAYEDWAEREPMTRNDTVARFYFTFLLLDELGFKPPRDEDFDPLEELIEQLQHQKEWARAWAARHLPDYGEAAEKAIPRLEALTNDPSSSVQIWAHYALARITGNASLYRNAIRSIGERDSCTRVTADDALGCLNRSPEQHRIEALGGFCITNEVKEIRRLVKVTDVNGIDHNGQCPLQYAVGNGHTEAVQILLEHGADPNTTSRAAGHTPGIPQRKRMSRGSKSCLHTAAAWRDNTEMISLLVKHGADVNAKDCDGQTPLDIAVESRRKSNAELLRKLGGKRGRWWRR